MTNPHVPLQTHAPLFSRGGLYKVGVKCFNGPDSLDRALRWGIVLERPVEVWEKGEFRVIDLPRMVASRHRGEE